MLPKDLVLDEFAIPKDFDALIALARTTFRVSHEQTTLERVSLKPEGLVHTPKGEWRVTQSFLEDVAHSIDMPLSYAYRITAELLCDNYLQRREHTACPVTICRIGNVATGLVVDGKERYRPACTVDVLRTLRSSRNLRLRRATIGFAGIHAEFVVPGRVIEPTAGDTVETGIAFSNSECGGRGAKASLYSYRLVCTNSAVMRNSLGIARWPNDPRMTPAGCHRTFTENIGSLFSRLDKVAALYEAVVDHHIPDSALVNLWRRLNYVLPNTISPDTVLEIEPGERRRMEQTVRKRVPGAAPAITRWNAYDVHNRITHAAHAQPLLIQRRLQELGGATLSEALDWPRVASLN